MCDAKIQVSVCRTDVRVGRGEGAQTAEECSEVGGTHIGVGGGCREVVFATSAAGTVGLAKIRGVTIQ